LQKRLHETADEFFNARSKHPRRIGEKTQEKPCGEEKSHLVLQTVWPAREERTVKGLPEREELLLKRGPEEGPFIPFSVYLLSGELQKGKL